MNATRILLACVALASTPAFPAGERLTQQCNTNYGLGEVMVEAPAAARERMIAVASDPRLDPALYEAMWRPSGARILDFLTIDDQVILSYDRVQDTEEIARAIPQEGALRGIGVAAAAPNTTQVCFATMPLPLGVTVTEFFHPGLNHYFLSSSEVETLAIERGAAGPGWQRTGESFRTAVSSYCHGSRPVFRFYGAKPNSHFFTVDTAECGAVRRNDPGWQYEGEAFGASMPIAGACPAGEPVFRLYNNGAARNDSNHRFTVKAAIRDEMIARGWSFEGVAMCLYPRPTAS